MPPVSAQETIPNFPLNGQELGVYALEVFQRVCKQRDVLAVVVEPATEAFKRALLNDWAFLPTFMYANASFEIAFQSHVIRNHETRTAFTLDPVFKFQNSTFAETRPFVRRDLNCPAPPIEGFSPDADHVVDCFTISVKVENPNLVRVHCGMPITITEKVQPRHGEMFGSIKNHEVRYDPADYGDPPPFLVLDQSAEFAAKWGLPFVESPAPPTTDALVGDTASQGDTNTTEVGQPTIEPNSVASDAIDASTPAVQVGAKALEFPKPPNRSRR